MSDVFISFEADDEDQANLIKKSLEELGLTVEYADFEDIPELERPAAFYKVQPDELSDFDGNPGHEGWKNFVSSLAETLERPDILHQENSDSPQGALETPSGEDIESEVQTELSSVQEEIRRLKQIEAELLADTSESVSADPTDRYFDDEFVAQDPATEPERKSHRGIYAILATVLIALAAGFAFFANEYAMDWFTETTNTHVQTMDFNTVKAEGTVAAYEAYLENPGNIVGRATLASTLRRHRGAIADVQRALVDTGLFDGDVNGEYDDRLSQSLEDFYNKSGVEPLRAFEDIDPRPIERLASTIGNWDGEKTILRTSNKVTQPQASTTEVEVPSEIAHQAMNELTSSPDIDRPATSPPGELKTPVSAETEVSRTADYPAIAPSVSREERAYRDAIEDGTLSAYEAYISNSYNTRHRNLMERAVSEHRTAVKRVQSALVADRLFSGNIDGRYDDEFRLALDVYFATSGSRSYANFFNIEIAPIIQLAIEIENWERPMVWTTKPGWAIDLSGTAQKQAEGCLKNDMQLCGYLGLSYRAGIDGAPKDLTKARALFKMSCEGGWTRACALLNERD